MGAEDLFAIVGLGNPGAEYERSRHNAGFWLLEKWLELHQSKSKSSGFSPGRWTEEKGTLHQKVKVFGKDVFLVKPMRFMNRSGEAALPILRYFKVSLDRTLVAYDELDLAPGIARLKMGGSSGGHRGVADFAKIAGSEAFPRLRIGIGHPRDLTPGGNKTGNFDVSNWVLGRPSKEDLEPISRALVYGADAVDHWLLEGFQIAQQKLHSACKLG